MAAETLECLSTTVRNGTGKSHFFGYLARHGKRLAAGETYNMAGDMVTRFRGDPRLLKALQNDLKNGNIAIVRTPALHVYDETSDDTQVIRLRGGTVGHEAPCWGYFSSS
jgi:hypothetical protein